jgi:hypothetical protein
MTTTLRRLVFTTHVTSSVGWAGAVLVFLALAVIGLTSQDAPTVRGVYLVMAPAAWFVLVPLAHASLLSGVAISLGTPWGLFRHYWVVSKLVITLFATVVLLIYMGTFRQMAGVAADPVVELGLVRNPSPMVHSILALILLLLATVLGVYKPFGMTEYGKRRQGERQAPRSPLEDLKVGKPRWVYFAWIVVLGLVVVFIAAHLMGSRFGAQLTASDSRFFGDCGL